MERMELPGNDIIEAVEEGAGLIDGWMDGCGA